MWTFPYRVRKGNYVVLVGSMPDNNMSHCRPQGRVHK